ncbi:MULTISPECIES: NAD(P)/FAD-dependent oxidoreductase [Pantoea]|jgi:glycine/D-amino acid oxidase-like deaminating enzyme|uniref:NAD(P)/FAD-dependent oxidoreductase n=1 Tax=Pantoea TaxID=53335 RepID=UPI000EA2F402|nr:MULTISPECIES: FAD-binding oxidoreductase [Pantoea]MBZ6402306.1 FAD-binding oxidoreductase [Pantoea piersonii]MBZ6408842.1 FAD-binding oxidoreductase [Pantoea piersonii]MBZ6425978.1 FAD-binding oxidoreductase [Pantoea piersonii]NYB03061.1 FAD-binding oxidoreductase [Pantoea piersonii]NYB05773.1 FAD-binding oxidoreductase [Pantoea piersonii]
MAFEQLSRVVVLGGGALGVSSALQLAKRGAAVTLVTEAELCSGASGRSLSWLNSAGERSTPYHALRMAGIDRYRTLFADDPSRDWLRFDGGLYWAADDLSGTRARHTYEKAHGYDSRLVTRDSLAQADAQVEGEALAQEAIFNPGEGWVSLPHLVAHLAHQLRALGGEIVEHAGKCEVVRSGQRASGIRLASGDILHADAVLVACGPATPDVVAPLGVTIPNGSPVSMLVITAPSAHGLKAVLNTPRAAVRPNPGNTFALDHDWYEEDIQQQADGSYSIDERVVAQLAAEASKLMKGEPLRAASWKLGLKPIPGDGEPVLGELESVPGCFVAFTHSGATLALIAGELLAEEILTGEKQPMLESFRPARFA